MAEQLHQTKVGVCHNDTSLRKCLKRARTEMIREGDYSLLLRRSDAAGQTPDRPFELQNFDESEANLVPFCIHTGDYKLRSSQTFVSERFGFHRSQLLQLRFERFCH